MEVDWGFTCRRTIDRCRRGDTGALAAREGLLGLPLTHQGKKARRCYEATSTVRTQYIAILTRKGRTLPDGSTGNTAYDKALAEFVPSPITA